MDNNIKALIGAIILFLIGLAILHLNAILCNYQDNKEKGLQNLIGTTAIVASISVFVYLIVGLFIK